MSKSNKRIKVIYHLRLYLKDVCKKLNDIKIRLIFFILMSCFPCVWSVNVQMMKPKIEHK